MSCVKCCVGAWVTGTAPEIPSPGTQPKPTRRFNGLTASHLCQPMTGPSRGSSCDQLWSKDPKQMLTMVKYEHECWPGQTEERNLNIESRVYAG